MSSLFHRFACSISLVSLFVFVTSFYWLANSFIGFNDFALGWIKALTVLAIGAFVMLLLLLPLDYLYYRKDKKICGAEGIHYKDFVRKKKSEKRELYEQNQEITKDRK